MSEIRIFNGDNVEVIRNSVLDSSIDFCYGDCIYESRDFFWSNVVWDKLKDGGAFAVQTDYHTAAEWKKHLDSLYNSHMINWISVEFDWGGRSTKSFAKKTDFIFIYSKGKNYKFYSDRVLIPKATAGTNLDKKGTGLKIPTDFWRDMSFSTVSRERVKTDDGKNIRWQKSLKLMDRLLLPFTDEGDTVLDPFLGSGTTGEWCKQNNRNFIGVENDPMVFEIARRRLFQEVPPENLEV